MKRAVALQNRRKRVQKAEKLQSFPTILHFDSILKNVDTPAQSIFSAGEYI
jgi:hypothetical protein